MATSVTTRVSKGGRVSILDLENNDSGLAAAINATLTWITKSANYTALIGESILANTSAGAWTLTLPASPVLGSIIRIADAAGTFTSNNLIVARNGKKIMGLSEDMTISTNNISISLIYSDETNGWRIV
jgi:hypothetical protein